MSKGEEPKFSSLLDFQGVGRVVESVRAADKSLGDKYLLPANGLPIDLDGVRHARADLATAISWAYTTREAHGDWYSDSRAKRRYKALGAAHRLARELVALIEDDELPLDSSLASRFRVTDDRGFHAVDFSQTMVGLRRLQEAAEKERARLRRADLHETAPLSHVEAKTAAYATAGNSFMARLGKAFEEGFGQSPSINFTSNWEATGPFVRFVEAVTCEMGHAMAPEGIRKAWKRKFGTGQTPRKE